jgi:hypothetical protein
VPQYKCLVDIFNIVSYGSPTFTVVRANNRVGTPVAVALISATDIFLAITMCILVHTKRMGLERSVMLPVCQVPFEELTFDRSAPFVRTHRTIDRLGRSLRITFHGLVLTSEVDDALDGHRPRYGVS